MTARVMVVADVAEGKEAEFEAAYAQVTAAVKGTPGHVHDELLSQQGRPGRYILLSEWESVDAFIAWEDAPIHREITVPMRPTGRVASSGSSTRWPPECHGRSRPTRNQDSARRLRWAACGRFRARTSSRRMSIRQPPSSRKSPPPSGREYEMRGIPVLRIPRIAPQWNLGQMPPSTCTVAPVT